MTRPRASLVSVADTPYYHCIGRCVRRAFLCGDDRLTGQNFDHRKTWILERLRLLSEVFAIDLCAYAVMSNHYHLVVRLDPERTQNWSDREIVERWTQLFSGPDCVPRYLSGAPLSDGEHALMTTLLPVWRARLTDLSWFMRCLNEGIARRANQEDHCTGHFWEGQFRSQALLDDAALLTVMTYVDLNPIRAGLVESPQDSDFTSIQQRIFEIARTRPHKRAAPWPKLFRFIGAEQTGPASALPFNLQDYLDLADVTGRAVHPTKHGVIPLDVPTILSTLSIAADEWLKTVTALHTRFRLFIGAPHRLRQCADRRGWRWIRVHAAARRLYGKANE